MVPSLRYGKNQKNNLDIQLVIDAMEVAYVNPLIDSFCIVSGDSDYMPLVGRLKSDGQARAGHLPLGGGLSGIFINACNEFIFLESVASATKPAKSAAPRSAIRITARSRPSSELIKQVHHHPSRIRTRIRCTPAS